MDKQQIEAIRKRMPSYDRPGKSELLTPYGTAMQDATALLKAYDALAAENAALRSTIDDLTAGEIHTCHDHCQRTACILRRENTALRSRLADIESQNRVMWDVANDREARLAEAARKLRVYGQHLPNCRSLIYLTSMPPKTQPCDCGLVTPDSASVEGEK